MIDIAALYRQIDPLRPLEADEDDLYVDWQQRLLPGDDVKSRLVGSLIRSASSGYPVTRLLTGHRGSGKTTELNRVRRALQSGAAGRKVFVSRLNAQMWLDLDDLQVEDLMLQVVRQLASDLRAEGMRLVANWYRGFFQSILARMRGVSVESMEVGIDPVRFSFTRKDFPSERDQFRTLLRGQLPTVLDLVNTELLPEARRYLKTQGYEDLLLIVDDLDKMPKKLVDDRHTNHEQLFLDNSSTLRAFNCSVLMTIPIDLAYSRAQGRLRAQYGAAIATVPLVTVADRSGAPVGAGVEALVEVVGRRALAAGGGPGDPAACAAALFEDRELLLRLVRLSGGLLRELFVLLTELLDRVDDLPVSRATVERYVPRAAFDLARGLFPADKEVLRQVAATHEAAEEPRFFDLLRNHYVFAYEAGLDGYWYGLNPLLHEIAL